MGEFSLDIGRILSPTSVNEFLNCHYEKEVLTVNRCNPTFYGDMLSLDDLDAYLSRQPAVPSKVQIVDAARDVSDESYIDDRGVADARKVAKLFYEGSTISFRDIETEFPKVGEVCRNFELLLSCPVKANAYLTPAAAQGFRVHHDTHDVFVLQLVGSKEWLIYQPVLELPLPGQGYYWETGTPGPPNTSITLRAGDLLYCPRGVPHQAHTTGEISLHLTIGALARTWGDFLLEIVADVATRDVSLRRALPPRFAMQGIASGELRDILTNLLEKVDLLSRPRQVLERIGSEFINSRRHMVADQALQLANLLHMTSTTRLMVRPGILSKLVDHSDHISIYFHQSEVLVPRCSKSAILYMFEHASFVPSDLPGELDDDERLLLIKRLVAEGLLQTARN